VDGNKNARPGLKAGLKTCPNPARTLDSRGLREKASRHTPSAILPPQVEKLSGENRFF
jgi:hypothetical protein